MGALKQFSASPGGPREVLITTMVAHFALCCGREILRAVKFTLLSERVDVLPLWGLLTELGFQVQHQSNHATGHTARSEIFLLGCP